MSYKDPYMYVYVYNYVRNKSKNMAHIRIRAFIRKFNAGSYALLQRANDEDDADILTVADKKLLP